MSQSQPPQPEVAPGNNEKVFGFFICLVGCGLLFYGLNYNFEPNGAAENSKNISEQWRSFWKMALLFLSGVAALFMASNFYRALIAAGASWSGKIGHRLWGRAIVILPLLASALVGLILVSIFAVQMVRAADERQPEFRDANQFAVTLPLENTGSGSGVTYATLSWQVPAVEISPHDGVAEMILAAVILILFGAAYAHIAQVVSDRGSGLVEKLLVPALGLFTFSVGAVEAQEAEDRERDIQLVQRTIPAMNNIPKLERKTIVRDIVGLPGGTRSEIVGAFDKLLEKFPRSIGLGLDEANAKQIDALTSQLTSLRNQMTKPIQITNERQHLQLASINRALVGGFADTGEQMRNVNARLTSTGLQNKYAWEKLQRLSRQQRDAICNLIFYSRQNKNADNTVFLKEVERRDKRAERDVLGKIWFGLIGESRKKGQEDRDYLASSLRSYQGLTDFIDQLEDDLQTEGSNAFAKKTCGIEQVNF